MKIGYVIASFDLKNLVARIPGCEKPIQLKAGDMLVADSGIPVSSEPVAVAPEFSDGKAILLTVEYDEQDLRPGPGASFANLVSCATIEKIELLNDDDSLKFGHVFNPAEVQTRRETHRRECLLAGEFARKYVVLRAMSKEANHIFPADWVYISNGSVLKTMAKRVVDAYLEGDRNKLISSTEKSLMLALDHAATMALSSSSPQHVTVAVADNRNLYRTLNAGEFFYDGNKPLKVESLIDVSADGVPSLIAAGPAKQRLLAKAL